MPPDFSFLSNPASANYQAPNLLGMAGQAMTLGSMAQQQQLQGLAIQKQTLMAQAFSDPAVMQAYSQLLSPGSSNGPNGPVSGNGQPIDLSPFSKYGIATQDLLSGAVSTAEKAASMQKDLAAAAYSSQQRLDLQLTNVQRLAASGAPPQVIASELQRINVDPSKFYDPQNPGTFVSNVATGLQDQKIHQDIVQSAAEFPTKLAGEQATAAKTWQDVAQGPALLKVKQIEAFSSAAKSTTERMKYLGGNIAIDTATGNVYQQHPDPNNPTSFVSTPIYMAGGQQQPPQVQAPATAPTPA